ncbi:sulfatase [bacterium]|nr:sulfatase [candidate division CSSED10-310 bacterium]
MSGMRKFFARWLRWSGLAPAACLGLLFCSCRMTSTTVSTPPSLVILISIDTLRADRLGGYGNNDALTPNLDRLSRESMLFSMSHSQACSTLPSHASLFTSRYPLQLGVLSGAAHQVIPTQVPILFEMLHQAGYYTASFNGGGYLDGSYGFDRGVDFLQENLDFSHSVPLVISLIETRMTDGEKRAERQPLFVFLHSYDVHRPYGYDERLAEYFELDAVYRTILSGIQRLEQRFVDHPMTFEEYLSLTSTEQIDLMCLWLLDTDRYLKLFHASDRTRVDDHLMFDVAMKLWSASVHYEAQRNLLQRCYDIGVRDADAHLGILFAALKRLAIWDRTLLIVCSDHGEEFMEHGMVTHPPEFYETLIHTPLLVKAPGRVIAPLVLGNPVGNIDIFPTICDLCGIHTPPETVGTSLALLRQDTGRNDRVFFSEEVDLSRGDLRAAVLTERYKLIQVGLEKKQAFDLQEDPGELRPNGEEAWRALGHDAELLIDRVKFFRSTVESEQSEPDGEGSEIDQVLRDRLDGLGYVH